MAQIKKILSSPLILLWIVVIIILIPILKPGFFSVHDETHIVDVYQMIRSIQTGGFPPRFAPDFNFGLGHPYFNFYYHLPFYMTTLFYYLGFSMTDAFKYMMGVAVVGAASGFYFFLRNHVGKIPAMLGTLVYLLSPYFAVDLYVRGAFGELFMFALFPWSAFLLKRFLDKPNGLRLGLASLSIGLLALSHNVLHPFTFLFLFFYGVVNLTALKNSPKRYFKLPLPFILGIGIASYYLLPAFLEIKYISRYEQFNIADHFPFIKQLIFPYWGYGVSIWGPLDDISFNIGVVNLVFLAISVFAFKLISKQNRLLLIFFWIVTGLGLILSNYRTLFFWESLQVLRLVQFPWRMLLITTISTSFISALVVGVVYEKFNKKAVSLFVLTLLSLILGLNLWHYHPSEYKNSSDEDYLKRYFANRTAKGNGERGALSLEYLNFTEDFIPPTIWQTNRPPDILQEIKFATGSGKLEFSKRGLSYDISYETALDSKILVAKAYFPGWQATKNQKKIEIEPYSEYGIISIPVAAGQGTLQLKFRDTPVRTISNLISAVATLFILVLLVYPIIKRIKK